MKMSDFPHHYHVAATARSESHVSLTSDGLPDLPSAAPPQFGGPGDQWSPETLLTAAVADCFILTFKAIARASKLDWIELECQAEGLLDKVERTLCFTEFRLKVRLTVADGVDPERARRLLDKSEHGCLVTNSMTSTITLETEVNSAG